MEIKLIFIFIFLKTDLFIHYIRSGEGKREGELEHKW